MELNEPVKWVLQSGKPVEAAPDALGTGHGFCTMSDPRGGLIKPGMPLSRFSSAPDALDLPHGGDHSHGDANLLGDGHTSSNGGREAWGPHNSLPGAGGMVLGGVIGALLMEESSNVRNDGSANHSGSGQGPGGSSEGVPQP